MFKELHFNKALESKFKSIICFWLPMPFNIETTQFAFCKQKYDIDHLEGKY